MLGGVGTKSPAPQAYSLSSTRKWKGEEHSARGVRAYGTAPYSGFRWLFSVLKGRISGWK